MLLVAAGDASPYCIGAVISVVVPNRSERNHSQLDKEAVAIIFTVRKFHQYLTGIQFTIYSQIIDHW